jgi:prophage DNA circulation protein
MSAYVSGQTGQVLIPTGSASYLTGVSGLGIWAATLQQASWRGLPFAVRSSLIRRGRRVAVHEYPFRDDVWVEDLGRGTRMVSFSAFLIGDDVFAQRDAMAAAAETAGTGTLVHPSLGTMSASLLEFSAGERQDLGRVVEIELSFIQTSDSQALYPTSVISTQATSISSAADTVTAAGSDFLTDAASAIALGYGAVQGAIGTAVGFVSQVLGTVSTLAFLAASAISLPAQILSQVLGAAGSVLGLVNDAGITFGAVAGLVGNYGRYTSAGLTTTLPATATAETEMDTLAANRATVAGDMGAVLTGLLGSPLDLPTIIQTAISSFQDAIPSPADQLRLLATLAAFDPAIPTNAAPIGVAITTIQTATAALVRRTACAALATATAAYQPTSYNDAMTQMTTVTALLDAESLSAADAGDTGSYLALQALRTAVTDDLVTRGAQLPSLVTVTRAVPIPSLTLAYELYQDATRSDDLIARADPIHPLFMPTSFEALAS